MLHNIKKKHSNFTEKRRPQQVFLFMIPRKFSEQPFYGAPPVDRIRQKHAGQKAYLFYRISLFENDIEVLKTMTLLRIFRKIIWSCFIYFLILLLSLFQPLKGGKCFIGPDIFRTYAVIRYSTKYLFLKTFCRIFVAKSFM